MALRACVVIPAYNAAKTIGPLVAQIKRMGLDPIVVNDGSTDQTARLASEAGAMVISHVKNRGKGLALRAGFAFAVQAGYEVVITLDSDGQHDPQEIPRLMETLEQSQAAIVIGHRLVNGSCMPRTRRWTNRFMSSIVSMLARQPIPDSQCGFRLIRRQVLTKTQLSGCHYDLETELLLAASRQGWTVASVPITTIYENQHSHIRPIRDGWRFLRLVMRYLSHPMPTGAERHEVAKPGPAGVRASRSSAER